jgi:hypothetical protein|tara:strand:+ start:106 stop:468 length:363 start_codon:yes stop_codon:yes gene_type:complete
MIDKLTEENLFLYAAKNYYNPTLLDIEEFYEDFNRFIYLKRLSNRYLEQDKLAYRLILNHLIIISNVFGIKPMLTILELKISNKHWRVIKPFLLFLKYIKEDDYVDISIDKKIADILRTI